MKRFTFVFIVLIVTFLSGCASSKKAAILGQKDSIALVSVISNRDINWKDEDSMKPGDVGIFGKRTLNRDPDLAMISNADELIVKAEQIFRDTVAGFDLINLSDKDVVLGSRAYQESKINMYINRDLTKPKEYRFVDSGDRNFPQALFAETGIRRTMYVEFNFTKAMAYGAGKFVGSLRANIDMRLLILDDHGKKIFQKKYSVVDGETTKVANSSYSESELMSLLEQAITNACYDFLEDLGK